MRTNPPDPSAWRTRTRPTRPVSTRSDTPCWPGTAAPPLGTLAHVRDRDRDHHCALVGEQFPLDPGQAAERIAHLHPGAVGRNDLDRQVAARDVELRCARRRRVIEHRGRLADRTELGGDGERKPVHDGGSTRVVGLSDLDVGLLLAFASRRAAHRLEVHRLE
jgi:hypothetical protein